MKKNNFLWLLLIAIAPLFLYQSCLKEQNYEMHEAYIIGFHSCYYRPSDTEQHDNGKGLVIKVVDTNDTVETRNLPDLYAFPGYLFENYRTTSFFPDSVQRKYKISFAYTKTPKEKRIISACIAEAFSDPIFRGGEHQVITLKAVKLSK